MSNEFGSSADERIWQVVAAIPEGSVATYGQVAELAALPNGARAVGKAMARLPKESRLPWHRVLNARGAVSLPGDAGRRQRRRLREEGHRFRNGRLDLDSCGWRPEQPTTERNRIDRVTTSTGDAGTTSLADGRRYRKSDPRIELVGALDEANSMLGLLAEEVDAALAEHLRDIQSRLFDAGAVAATGTETADALDWDGLAASLAAQTQDLNSALEPLREFILPGGGRAASVAHVARTVVRRAERAWWRASEGALSGGARGARPSHGTALSGGARGACPSHEGALSGGARGACPSHEGALSGGARGACPSHEDDDALRGIAVGVYLNRLSDYLFVLARTVAREERLWRRAPSAGGQVRQS